MYPLLLLLLAAAPPADTTAGEVRVRLFDAFSPREAVVTPRAPLALYAGLDPLPLATIPAGQAVRVVAETGRLAVASGSLQFYTPALRVSGEADARAPVAFAVEAAGTTRHYSGRLEIDLDGGALRLVHPVDLEQYVAAVVQHEYGLDDDEGTRAMAIAARTYVLYTRGQLSPDYDVVDHVGSQVFAGVEGVSPRARAAAEATRGQVLVWQGRLARAVYSASNGGVAASNQDVWTGGAVPYLQSHPDPADRVSPHRAWQTELPRRRVLAALSDAFGRGVKGFVVESRSDDGRVARVTLQRDGGREQTVSGQQFRMTLSDKFGVTTLRSTLFDVRREGDAYVFEGRGFGHGVGLSQWGAHARALDGEKADEILAFYYPGTTIERLPATPLPDAPPALADAGTPPPADVPPADVPSTDASEGAFADATDATDASPVVDAGAIAAAPRPPSAPPADLPAVQPDRAEPPPATVPATPTWTGPRPVRATTTPRRGW